MTFYEFAWTVIVYAFLGWCTEVVFAAANSGKFVNRGFLNGPVCPIYGFGVFIVNLCLRPISGNIFVLYLGSVLLTSLLELVTGFAMEKLFHKRWWDYSDVPLNIGGYVCLKFSLLWGIGCVAVVDVVHPLIADAVGLMPIWLGAVATAVCWVLLGCDTALSVIKVNRFNRALAQLAEVGRALRAVSDKIGSGVAGGTVAVENASAPGREELARRRAELAHKKAAVSARMAKEYKRLLTAFPDIRELSEPEFLDELKERISSRLHRK